MDILKELTKLDFTFTGSLMNVVLEHYSIKFTNSNVVDHQNKLSKVKAKLERGNIVNEQITLDEINSIITTYNNLILEYLRINELDTIPKSLKLYQLKKDILQHHVAKTNIEIKEFAKEVIKEVLTPTPRPETTKKLTKKQQIEQRAKELTQIANLRLLQKRANH
jgi:hypothetical protein